MNRDSLIANVAAATGLPKGEIEQALLASLAQVTQALRRGDDVSLVGFGRFSVSARRPRRGVNPRNPAQEIRIPAVKVVKFQAGKRLKEAVRG